MVVGVRKKTGKRFNIVTEEERCGRVQSESSDKVLCPKNI